MDFHALPPGYALVALEEDDWEETQGHHTFKRYNATTKHIEVRGECEIYRAAKREVPGTQGTASRVRPKHGLKIKSYVAGGIPVYEGKPGPGKPRRASNRAEAGKQDEAAGVFYREKDE